MKISIVMTSYNGERFLSKQLLSLKNQTIKVDEVIIIDDNSIDETVSVISNFIEEFNLEHWKLHTNPTNIGFKKNFEKALKFASGDLIYLCDQDDIWNLDKIEVMHKVFDENNHIKLLASSFSFINQEGIPFEIEQIKNKSNQNMLPLSVKKNDVIRINYDFVLKENFAQGCCMAITKEIVDDYLLRKNTQLPHDWSMVLLAASQDSCYFYNRECIQYRIHDKNTIGLDSLVQGNRLQSRSHRLLNRIEVLEEENQVYTYLLDFDEKTSENKKVYNNHKNWMEVRLDCLKNRNILKLMFKYIFKYNKNCYNLRAFGGDLVYLIRYSK